MISDIQFDEEKHEYTVDGRILPSVTTLLKGVGVIKGLDFMTEEGAKNGKRRHKLTELYDLGTLDYGSIALEDMPYLEGWIKAKEELKIEVDPSGIEVKLYHPVLGYAGTSDRICPVNRQMTVTDLKTGAPAKWHVLQLILYGLAYSILFEQPLPELMGIYLKSNGKYKMKKHSYKEQSYAIAAARIQSWKGRK